MRRTILLLLVQLSACGGGTPAPVAADASAESDNRCQVKPAIAATAKETPRVLGCSDRGKLTAITDACNGGDAGQCYVVGACLAMEILMLEGKDPVRRARAIEQAKKAMRVACDGGIAEGCDNRAGLIENQATSPAARKEACEDVIRGCHLGKQADCLECLACPG